MAQTAQAQVQDMIERASRLGDDVLASEIRAFASSRQFGLVFEHNRPERMRLYGKPVSIGDVVQVLPERGKPEDAASKLLWCVDSIDGATAELSAYKSQSYTENNEGPRSAELEDLVAIAEYDQPIYAGLREIDRVERGGDKPCQVVINGENYHALESLLFCYAGKVDCIYIDPPYNSGAKDWKYNNDYVDSNDQYRHSKWLAFMERRLKLAKQLLNPNDSVLIVTIDEKEYLRLGMLLEQIFPNSGIQMVSITNNNAGTGRSYEFARVNEFAFFVRIGDAAILPEYEYGAEHKSVLWDVLRRSELANIRPNKKTQFFPIFINDKTGKIQEVGDPITPDVDIKTIVPPEGCTAVFPIRDDGIETSWSCKKEELLSRIEKGYVRVGKRTPNKPQKYSLSYIKTGAIADIESGKAVIEGYNKDGSVQAFYTDKRKKNPPTVLTDGQYDARANGSNLLNAIIGNRFDYPKSLYAVYDCLRFVIANKPDALVVDFFAGSGTTLHAVSLLNANDGGHRRCICVTNNEVSAKEAKSFTREKMRQRDLKWESHGIAQYVTWPRTKCSIEGVDITGNPLEGNYGCIVERYEEIDGDVVDPTTGKKMRGKVYKKTERPVYAELAAIKKSDGFEENAIFFDLTYLNPDAVELGAAFEEVAPLLWLRAGARGSMIKHEEQGYTIADAYAVLFDYSRVKDFVPAVLSTPNISCAFIVTDDSSRFASVKAELGGMDCVRLYESYLRSFKIAAEDAVR